MGNTSIPLDYAARPSWHRRKQFRWVVAAVLISAAMGVATWKRKVLIAYVRLHYYHHVAMARDVPEGHVAADWNPEPIKGLIASGKGYMGGSSFATDGHPAIYVPPSLVHCENSTNSVNSSAVLFLHGRRSGIGEARLTVVKLWSIPYTIPADVGDCVALRVTAYSLPDPGFWQYTPPAEPPGTTTDFMITRHVVHAEGSTTRVVIDWRMRYYTGQPDPIDPSRFTIKYELYDESDVIDGVLLDDGSVKLTPRRARLLPSNIWDLIPPDPPPTTTQQDL